MKPPSTDEKAQQERSVRLNIPALSAVMRTFTAESYLKVTLYVKTASNMSPSGTITEDGQIVFRRKRAAG